MKVMIMGMDGYLGWPLCMHLSSRGHEVSGVDNLSRRNNVNETARRALLLLIDVYLIGPPYLGNTVA